MIFLWTVAMVAAFFIGYYLAKESEETWKIVLGIILMVAALAAFLVTIINENEVETSCEEANYTRYLVSQNEDKEDPLYVVQENDQFYYLYGEGKLVKEARAATSETKVVYFDQLTSENGNLAPRIDIHVVVHHIDKKAWFIKTGDEDVIEYENILYVPRGAIVNSYDLPEPKSE